MEWAVASGHHRKNALSWALPDESDSLQTCYLASCDGGIFLILIKIGWHLQHSSRVYLVHSASAQLVPNIAFMLPQICYIGSPEDRLQQDVTGDKSQWFNWQMP